MSTYSEFREEILFALYEEERNENISDFISFKKLAAEYDINWKPGWLFELQRELREEGLIRGPANGQNDDMAIGRLSGAGMRSIEYEHGTLSDGVPTLIVKPDEPLVVHPLQVDDAISTTQADEPTLTAHDPPPVNSANWTGFPRQGVLSSEAVATVKSALLVVEDAIEKTSASNEERAQARAYVLAIHALADAPEPPTDLIWCLIERANSVAGIAAFFVALMALFVHG